MRCYWWDGAWGRHWWRANAFGTGCRRSRWRHMRRNARTSARQGRRRNPRTRECWGGTKSNALRSGYGTCRGGRISMWHLVCTGTMSSGGRRHHVSSRARSGLVSTGNHVHRMRRGSTGAARWRRIRVRTLRRGRTPGVSALPCVLLHCVVDQVVNGAFELLCHLLELLPNRFTALELPQHLLIGVGAHSRSCLPRGPPWVPSGANHDITFSQFP